MRKIIFDIETDGLLETVTKIHCLSYFIIGENIKNTLTNYEDIKEFFNQEAVFIGHNIICYDLEVLLKILQINYPRYTIDTLNLSWYLYPQRKLHALEEWAIEYGEHKVVIQDWKSQTIEGYKKRCEKDVLINLKLFNDLDTYINLIYEGNTNSIYNYLDFKIRNLRDRLRSGLFLDINLCIKSVMELEPLIENKINILTEAMPYGKILKAKPKCLYKVNGELSVLGTSWFKYLEDNNLPENTEIIQEKGNPGSPDQLKDWLFSLGWKPITFKINKKGEKVPQISLPYGQGLCESIKDLFEDYPVLRELDSLYMLKHRLTVFKTFLECKDKNFKIYCNSMGYTNTMRICHTKPVANMVGADKPWGKNIRNCIKVPNNNYIMFGVDMSALEDTTKQHYIYFFDPDYVNHMRVPDFCPHLDIAMLANLLSREDSDFYKWYEKTYEADNNHIFSEEDKVRFKRIKKVRGKAKQVNFACVYGAGAPKIAETARIPLQEAKKLHKIYWQRNKAVKQIVQNLTTKVVNNQMWLFNPLSRLYYYIKSEKDLFSTLNQSSGVWVFDLFILQCKKQGLSIPLEYHDEVLEYKQLKEKEETVQIFEKAIKNVNEILKPNVEFKISIQTGVAYGAVH